MPFLIHFEANDLEYVFNLEQLQRAIYDRKTGEIQLIWAADPNGDKIDDKPAALRLLTYLKGVSNHVAIEELTDGQATPTAATERPPFDLGDAQEQ